MMRMRMRLKLNNKRDWYSKQHVVVKSTEESKEEKQKQGSATISLHDDSSRNSNWLDAMEWMWKGQFCSPSIAANERENSNSEDGTI